MNRALAPAARLWIRLTIFFFGEYFEAIHRAFPRSSDSGKLGYPPSPLNLWNHHVSRVINYLTHM